MKLTNFILAAVILCTLTQCKPEATAGDGWAGGIEGYYVNTIGEEVTVNRIDDTHVSISATTSAWYTLGFSNVTMNSATTFTLNSIQEQACPNNTILSGTGTASNNNITLFMQATATPSGDPDNDCVNWNYTLSATKQ
jgi:hypothetical protein